MSKGRPIRFRLAALGNEAAVLGGALVAVAGVLLGLLARDYLVEPDAIGAVCTADGAPWWCLPRHWLVMLFHWGLLGGGALALAGLAVVAAMAGLPYRLPAFAALAAAGVGLALYNASLSAPAALLAGLLLAGRHQRAHEPGRLRPDRSEQR